jgi:hypothetical protein
MQSPGMVNRLDCAQMRDQCSLHESRTRRRSRKQSRDQDGLDHLVAESETMWPESKTNTAGVKTYGIRIVKGRANGLRAVRRGLGDRSRDSRWCRCPCDRRYRSTALSPVNGMIAPMEHLD